MSSESQETQTTCCATECPNEQECCSDTNQNCCSYELNSTDNESWSDALSRYWRNSWVRYTTYAVTSGLLGAGVYLGVRHCRNCSSSNSNSCPMVRPFVPQVPRIRAPL